MRNRKRVGLGAPNFAGVPRTYARALLWGAVALVFGKGLVTTLAPAKVEPTTRTEGPGLEGAVVATAERFARLYLEDPSPNALAPYLAAGATLGEGRPSSTQGVGVAQTSVVRGNEVGDGRVVVTVSCELRDSRTLFLAVPIVRQEPGEAAVLGAPSIVAVPAVTGVDPERPRSLAGPEAGAIADLVGRFLPAYLSAAKTSDLSYLLAPGSSVVPLAGSFELLSVGRVTQLGGGEGRRRQVIAVALVRDPISGASYPVAYRLALVELAGRWYVERVLGGLS